LLKNTDRVKIACLAQLVNVIAPIMTETGGAAWRQTTFYPFMQAANFGHGVVLHPVIDSPSYACEDFDEVPYIESVAIYNEKNNEVIVFAVNRSIDEDMDFTVDLQGFSPKSVNAFSDMSGYDCKQTNTKTDGAVKPKESKAAQIENNSLKASLRPLSWNMIRIGL